MSDHESYLTANTRCGELRPEKVHPESNEHKAVMSKHRSCDKHKHNSNVGYIKRVYGHKLGHYGRSKVVELWHDTSAKNVTSILRSGFRLPKKITALSTGIYFTNNSCKAMSYPKDLHRGDYKELLLCSVAVVKQLSVTSRNSSMNLRCCKAHGCDSVFYDSSAGGWTHDELVVHR